MPRGSQMYTELEGELPMLKPHWHEGQKEKWSDGQDSQEMRDTGWATSQRMKSKKENEV